MANEDLPPGASTPEATAAVAQSREQPIPTDTALPPDVECGRVGRHFEIDDGVAKPVQTRPYERKPGDPLYRPLRIFSLDPSASPLEGAVATVNVAYEPLNPGPVGAVFEVDDYDFEQKTHWGRVDLDDKFLLLSAGRAPSISDPLFHQQMVYAVCSMIHAAFRRALGRHVTWGFPARDGNRARLRIRPHARKEHNAYYDRDAEELCFGYFEADKNARGNNLPGGVVFTCLSHDIVAHEVTHALLDGLRAHFSEPTSADVLGFHEGFADLIATFQHFSYREVVQAAIRSSKGKLEDASLLTDIANQFGATQGSTEPLRTAFTDYKKRKLKMYRKNMEAHQLGEIIVQAVFAAALTVFRRKTAQYLRLATGGTGHLPEGELPRDLQEILGEQASKLASQFLSICIRAIDYCPPVDLDVGEYLRALITADYDLVPDDRWGYREALIDAFRERGIYPPKVRSLSEESLRWESSDLPPIPALSFANLRFEGDPANPASASELVKQAEALGSVLGCSHNLGKFGLAVNGDPELRGDTVSLPRVQSIRSSRRIGPDGQVVFDLIAEVTQRRHVRTAKGTFGFFGGATVIIGPCGEVRYLIAKNVLNNTRRDQQREFILGGGQRYWELKDGVIMPLAIPFKLMHTPREAERKGTSQSSRRPPTKSGHKPLRRP